MVASFNLLVYLILLALSVAGAYFLNNRFSYTPLLFLLLIFPLDAFCALRARRCVYCLRSPDFHESEQGSASIFRYTYENHSRFLVCHLSVALRLTGPKGSRFSNSGAALDIAPQATETFRFSITPKHIGVYQVRMQSAYVYGPAGLFSIKLPVAQPGTAVVTPPRGGTAAYEFDASSQLDDSAVNTARRGQSSDNFTGAREYEPGDPLRSIHWKLTAHNRKIMTRLYEEEEEGYLTVAVDMRSVMGTAEQILCIHDTLCRSAYRSLCDRVEQGGKVRLIFFNGDNLQMIRIQSKVDLTEAAIELASAEPAVEALTNMPGILAAAGGALIVSAHPDTALARRLGEFSDGDGGTMLIFVAQAQFEQQKSAAFFKYLADHGVNYTITEAAQARRTQKERLKIDRACATYRRKDERILHRQQNR